MGLASRVSGSCRHGNGARSKEIGVKGQSTRKRTRAGARPSESWKRPSNGFAAICCSVNGNNSGWGSQLRRQLGLHIDEVVPNSWLPRSHQATWGGREHLSNVMSEGEPIDEVPSPLMCPSLPTLAAHTAVSNHLGSASGNRSRMSLVKRAGSTRALDGGAEWRRWGD